MENIWLTFDKYRESVIKGRESQNCDESHSARNVTLIHRNYNSSALSDQCANIHEIISLINCSTFFCEHVFN